MATSTGLTGFLMSCKRLCSNVALSTFARILSASGQVVHDQTIHGSPAHPPILYISVYYPMSPRMFLDEGFVAEDLVVVLSRLKAARS